MRTRNILDVTEETHIPLKSFLLSGLGHEADDVFKRIPDLWQDMALGWQTLNPSFVKPTYISLHHYNSSSSQKKIDEHDIFKTTSDC